MKSLMGDPVVLICCGVILVGIVGLVWGIATFRRLPKSETGAKAPMDDLLSGAPGPNDFGIGLPSFPSPSVAAPVPVPVPTPAVSKDVADRLDGMTQRLAEMQALLSKQASAAAGDPAAQGGAVGQGFSPETIDRLLKIIGNVVQQVDILQKNLNPAKEGAAIKPGNPSPFGPKP